MTDELSIRLDPFHHAAALGRVFVGDILQVSGVEERVIEDVRMAVSDLASGLIETGNTIEIRASIDDLTVRFEGNAPEAIGAGPSLLGERMSSGGGRWTITLDRV